MNNKRGMTLVEMVITILIISIAGIIFLSGFSAVIRTFSKANDYKNNSNALMKFVESTERSEGLLTENEVITYTIKAETISEPIQVDTNLCYAQIKNNEHLNLKVMNIDAIELVYSTSYYSKLKENVINLMREYNMRLSEVKTDPTFNLQPHGDVLLKDNVPTTDTETISRTNTDVTQLTNIVWRLFPNEILPNNLKKSLNKYYIKIWYPWDYLISIGGAHHGGVFYYLSTYPLNPGRNEKGPESENIKVVYNPNEDVWYYTDSDAYLLNFYKDENQLIINGNSTLINNNTEFYRHVKEPKNGWKILNINAEYTPENTDRFWQR